MWFLKFLFFLNINHSFQFNFSKENIIFENLVFNLFILIDRLRVINIKILE